jgi:dihydrofolate reductase
MIFSIIVAADSNGAIGLNGEMPWKKLTADLQFFKNTTMHHWCILGRKTYNALGNRALPGRKFIVVTRDNTFTAADSIIANSIVSAMNMNEIKNEEEVFILGGGEIYKQAIPMVNRIYLTRIHSTFEGDTYFFIPDPENWEVVSRMDYEQDEKNPYKYSFIVFDKKANIRNI